MAKAFSVVALLTADDKLQPSSEHWERVRWLVGKADLRFASLRNYTLASSPDLYLVFGSQLQSDPQFKLSNTRGARLIFLPPVNDSRWTSSALTFAKRLIQDGTADLEMRFVDNRLSVQTLCPF